MCRRSWVGRQSGRKSIAQANPINDPTCLIPRFFHSRPGEGMNGIKHQTPGVILFSIVIACVRLNSTKYYDHSVWNIYFRCSPSTPRKSTYFRRAAHGARLSDNHSFMSASMSSRTRASALTRGMRAASVSTCTFFIPSNSRGCIHVES